MTFKNAFKLLLSKFSCVWSILLYVIILLVILTSLGLTFILPVYHAFSDAGVGIMVGELIASVLDGASLTSIFESVRFIFDAIGKVFADKPEAATNSALFVVLVLTVAYRFILGLYELPLVAVIQGFMSDNARYGYTSRFVSQLGRSVLFSVVKMLFMTIYDTLMHLAVYGVGLLVSGCGVIFVPFAAMLVYIILLSLRYSLIASWSPAVVVGGKGIFSGLTYSIKFAAKSFGSIYLTFMMVWIMIIAFCSLIGIFTFLVGLIIAIPVCMFFINLLNMTFYYGRNGKSYYIDGAVYDPIK